MNPGDGILYNIKAAKSDIINLPCPVWTPYSIVCLRGCLAKNKKEKGLDSFMARTLLLLLKKGMCLLYGLIKTAVFEWLWDLL